jgi:hypothetical protein
MGLYRFDLPEVILQALLPIMHVADLSRTCMSKGFLARTSFDISPEMSQSQSRQQTLSSALKLRLKWQDLCVQCGSAVSENGMRHLTPDQDRALSIIVRTYDLQIRDLEYTAADGKCLKPCTESLWPSAFLHNGIDQKALYNKGRLLSEADMYPTSQ